MSELVLPATDNGNTFSQDLLAHSLSLGREWMIKDKSTRYWDLVRDGERKWDGGADNEQCAWSVACMPLQLRYRATCTGVPRPRLEASTWISGLFETATIGWTHGSQLLHRTPDGLFLGNGHFIGVL